MDIPLDLSVVVPVYHSEDSLTPLAEQIIGVCDVHAIKVEIIFVNDGSTDGSWRVMQTLAEKYVNVRGINLRRNFGQDNAVMTGLRHVRAELVAIMDDDLQHDPADLPRLVEAARQGHDVVYASYRVKRQRIWKNLGSWVNGKTAEWVLGKPPHLYLSPYKIMRKEVVDAMCAHTGPFPYVDGLLFSFTSHIGQIWVEHHPRPHGVGHFSLHRSVSVWLRLFSSFSVQPLRLVTWCGLLFAAIGLLGALALVGYRLLAASEFYGPATGWASLMVTILVLGGIQMVFLGVMGEYIGRTYLVVNRKPQAMIRNTVNLPDGAAEP